MKRNLYFGQGRTQTKGGKSYFFGIGINDYQHFTKLENAEKDIEDFMRLLESKYELDETYVLLGPEATYKNIINHFDFLSDKLKEEDKLIIYYSGHGHLHPKSGRGYWIPFDAEEGNTALYIRNVVLQEYISELNCAHIFLISDACFSGTFFTSSRSGTDQAMDKLEARRSRWAICSGRHDEKVEDGIPGDNSPFSKALLKKLSQNDQERLNVMKLVDEVTRAVANNYDQQPIGQPIHKVGHEDGQYIFKFHKNHNVIHYRLGEDQPMQRRARTREQKRKFLFIGGTILLVIFLGIYHWATSVQKLFDRDNNRYLIYTLDNNTQWLGDDLQVKWENALQPDSSSRIRLYNWSEAEMACQTLGDGWRLPTKEDWEELIAHLTELDELEANPTTAFLVLRKNRKGFNGLQLAGWKNTDGLYSEKDLTGFYWINTIISQEESSYLLLEGTGQQIYYFNLDQTSALACRCMKPASDL